MLMMLTLEFVNGGSALRLSVFSSLDLIQFVALGHNLFVIAVVLDVAIVLILSILKARR